MQFRAREAEIVFQPLGDEIVIYDYERQIYHHLNRTAALVWKTCDGVKSVAEITEVVRGEISSDANEQTVWSALLLLDEAKLLEKPAENNDLETRRTFLSKAVVSGGAALIGAAISTIVAPTVAQAQSSCSVAVPCCW